MNCFTYMIEIVKPPNCSNMSPFFIYIAIEHYSKKSISCTLYIMVGDIRDRIIIEFCAAL